MTLDDLWEKFRVEMGSLRMEIRDEIRGEVGSLRTELREQAGSLHAEIGSVRTELRQGLTTVRFDFAHQLTTQIGDVRAELGEFHGEFSAFRDDALGYFDHIYQSLDLQSSEYQALRAAVERLEKQPPPPSS